MASIVGSRDAAQEPLFSRDSISWAVNREAALLLGGGRALLMQLAHPAVAAGVDEHSDFRERPLHRLQRTLDLSFSLAFGTRQAAEAAAARINARHRTVRGEGYSALDPDLLLWVHATLVDSSLTTYQAFVRPLSRAQRAAYIRESQVTGMLLGIPADRFPTGLSAFEAYVGGMVRDRLKVDERARRLARHVLTPPFPGMPAWSGMPLATMTAGLLPPSLRESYGLAWGPGRRAAFLAATRMVTAAVAVMPGRLREVPQGRR